MSNGCPGMWQGSPINHLPRLLPLGLLDSARFAIAADMGGVASPKPRIPPPLALASVTDDMLPSQRLDTDYAREVYLGSIHLLAWTSIRLIR